MTADDKEQIRNEIRQLRRELPPEQKRLMDRQITEHLLHLPQLAKASCIYLYASTDQEVDTWGLIEALWKRNVPVALPRTEGKTLRFCFVDNLEQLKTGKMRILEPVDNCPTAECRNAPVIVPGLAFSSAGERIGYGGGYYDRFLEQEPEHARIALAYPFQVRSDVIADAWDRRIHRIVLPDRIIDCMAEPTGRYYTDSGTLPEQ